MKTIYAILVVVLCTSIKLYPQTVTLAQANKPSNMGKEFWFCFPTPSASNGLNPQPTVNIICPVVAHVTISSADGTFTTEVLVAANTLTTVDLPLAVCVAYQKTDQQPSPPDQVYSGRALHVVSDFPIVLSAIMASSFSTDSFLVLPVEAMGTEYVAATMLDWSWQFVSYGYILPAQIVIVAMQNQTSVDITVGGTLGTVTAGGLRSGQTKTVILNKGDVYSLCTSQSTPMQELSGTIIRSTKRISVISGHYCGATTTDCSEGSYLVESQLPTHTWGRTLLIPRYSRRTNSLIMKLFGVEKNTDLWFNSNYFRTLQCTASTDGNSYFTQRANTTGNASTCYSSTRPIAATVFNPCFDEELSAYGDGKPFQMGIIPNEQFQTHVIIPPVASLKISYLPVNLLGVVLELNSNGTVPQDLEYGIMQGSGILWRKFSTVFGQDIAPANRFSVPGTTQFGYKECPVSGKDVIYLRGKTKFSCYVISSGSHVSSANFASCLALDVKHLTDSSAPRYQYTTSATSASGRVVDMPADSTIRSNLAKIFLNYGSSNVTLNADPIYTSTIETLPWSIDVIDSSIDAIAYLTTSDRAGNDTTITITFKAQKTVVPPQITAIGTTTLCEGDSIVLRCQDGYKNYLWSTNDTTQQIVVRCTVAGKFSYSVSAENSDAQRSTSKPFTITVNAKPIISGLTQSGDTLRVQNSSFRSYTWFCNDTLLTNENAYYIIIRKTAKYSVRAIDTRSGCVSDLDSIRAILEPNDVAEMSSPCCVVYPNPVDDVLRVVSNADGSIALYDQLGGLCEPSQNFVRTVALRTERLPMGQYYLVVTLSKGERSVYAVQIVR